MIVMDASAAIDIIHKTVDGVALRNFITRNEKVISCELYRAEVASVLRKFTRISSLTAQVASAELQAAIALVDEFYPIEHLQDEAFHESVRLGHSTYDMFYFVLARRTGSTLLTLDRKLMRLCEENGVNCVSEVLL